MKFTVLAALVPLLGALSTAAFTPVRLSSRQAGGFDDLPAACNSVCASTLDLANKCQGGTASENTNACLEFCSTSGFDAYETCANCILDNTEGVSDDDKALIGFALDQAREQCQEIVNGINSTDSSNSTTTGSTAISGSSTSASVSATRTLVSPTSIASSHASSATAAASSAASAAGSASASASAAGSGNSDSGASARTTVGGIVAFIGLAMGVAVLA
ncbi:hypothetical protein I302_103587 [Kwoniella bestiolae CBS 10118]|uniref:Extracellular membrane protein CFEM domain-containing protein n=1 Tax=Kwoniella bestiolae CBS 10118 TaxID=1296100 RepID=A0A1B9G8W2_9TREE|nr:hypothetical protein I302_02288 [Kwoniella bestiolae CBS 10118]OCF27446.1 hypothetical protein I302_02288 [Kwoniella bestiolae CBS 10118]